MKDSSSVIFQGQNCRVTQGRSSKWSKRWFELWFQVKVPT